MFEFLAYEKDKDSCLCFLNKNKDRIFEINSYETGIKKKILKTISLLNFPHDNEYSDLYMSLADLDELWYFDTDYNIPLISYFCYNYHNSYHKLLLKLAKKEDIWYLKNHSHNYSPLSFLIISYRDYNKENTFEIIQKLTQYKNLWLETDSNKNTPLHDICLCKESNIASIIQQFPEEIFWSMTNTKNITPLHNLCLNYNLTDGNIANFFVSLLRYPNLWTIKDELGYTPLHLITKHMYGEQKYKEFFDYFEKNNNCWNITNNLNKTPIDLHTENSNSKYTT